LASTSSICGNSGGEPADEIPLRGTASASGRGDIVRPAVAACRYFNIPARSVVDAVRMSGISSRSDVG
jgi:hypothetical protein